MRAAVRFASWILTALAGAAALPAQADRLARTIDAAIADLGEPARVEAARQRLENLGRAAVEPLRARLRTEAGGGLDDAVRLQLVHVLGRLGGHAVPAVPELCALLNHDSWEVGRQSLLSLLGIVPFCSAEVRAQIGREVDAAQRVRHSQTAFELRVTLQLVGDPTPERLARAMRGNALERLATHRLLAVRPDLAAGQTADVAASLREALQPALPRGPIRWIGPRQGASPACVAAEALLAITREPMAGDAARVLLDHERGELRRRAVAWLQDHGARLPLRERADLVGRLWDVDPEIVLAAADALAGWGARGLVGLPALRLMQRTAPSGVAAACERAATAVVAAHELAPADRAWLDAFDAALRGEPAAPPTVPASPAVAALLPEVLLLAQWHDGETLARLLDLADAAGVGATDTVQAVLGWLERDDPAVTTAACAWLARRAGAVRAAVAGEGDPMTLLHAAICMAPEGGTGSAVEAAAHFLLAGASPDRIVAGIDDGNRRVVTHALALAIAHPAALVGLAPRLHELLRAPGTPQVQARWGPYRVELLADVTDQLRTLAAVALLVAGERVEPAAGLDHTLRTTMGVTAADLASHVAQLRERGGLPALLDRLEAQCRAAMGVPPHLRWPSIAAPGR